MKLYRVHCHAAGVTWVRMVKAANFDSAFASCDGKPAPAGITRVFRVELA